MDREQRQKAAKQLAMKKLLVRDRSEAELRKLLEQEGFDGEETEEAVSYVKSFGYVNDRRYAENYVMSAGRKKSRTALRSFLQEKGVSREDAEAALAELPAEEGPLIRSLLEKRAGKPHEMEDREKRKLFAYLARRGFAPGDIWTELRNYIREAEAEEL